MSTPGERIAVSGVVHTIPERVSVSGRRETYVAGRERAQRLRPELEINCYLVGPLHSNPEAKTTVSGAAVLIPAKLSGTNRPDRLTGDGAGEVIVGFGARDRLRGRDGHDCLIE